MAFDGLLIRLLVTVLSLAASVEAFAAAGASSTSVKNPRPSSTSMLRAMSHEEVVHSRRKALVGIASMAVLASVLPAQATAATINQTETITKSTSGGSDAKSTDPKTNVVSNTSSSKSTATSSKATASNNAKQQQLENPGDVKNCPDFKDYKQAKTWYDTYFSLYGDVARLDGDKDGIPCESLPGAPIKTKK